MPGRSCQVSKAQDVLLVTRQYQTLNPSSDKNEGMHCSEEGEGMTPDLSCVRERAGEVEQMY